MQIWEADVNAKGGLLGRPVKLVYYDDQSNPANVPSIVTKLLDVDKVDFLIGENGTNIIAPAMPLVMRRHLVMLSLFGLAVNSEFSYDRYFSMNPAAGPHPKESFTEGFFRVSETLPQKPKTIAIAGAEFSKNAMDGGRTHAKEAGLQIVYDQAYPPQTIDYTPIARAIGAVNADLVLVCSYPPDTISMIRAVHEAGLNTQLFGGAMVGTPGDRVEDAARSTAEASDRGHWWARPGQAG